MPTTTGTGSESTTICVLDVLSLKVKTGISHARLRPTLAVIDPSLTLTQPAGVTAAAGMDILCHALESYTARPYTSYERKRPEQRVPYCGSNPIADMWSEKALSLLAESFRTAVHHGDDEDARADDGHGRHVRRAWASATRVSTSRTPTPTRSRDGSRTSTPRTTPPTSRWSPTACPSRSRHPRRSGSPSTPHRSGTCRAARLLGPGADEPDDPAELLPSVLIALMRDIEIPNGIGAVGYTEADIPDLVDGTMKQQRLLATAPKPVTEDDIAGIYRRSLTLW